VGKRISLPDHRNKSRATARHRRNRRNARARKRTISQLQSVDRRNSPPSLSPSFSPVSHSEFIPDRLPVSFRSNSPLDFDPAELRLACFREPSPSTLFFNSYYSPVSPPLNLPETREQPQNIVNNLQVEQLEETVDYHDLFPNIDEE